jgi:small subunit ribosomal protein S13
VAAKGVGKKGKEFKYIVRLADTDIDGNKLVVQGLTQIKGIGARLAAALAQSLGVPREEKIGNLSDEAIEQIRKALEGGIENYVPAWFVNKRKELYSGKDKHFLGHELVMSVRDDVNILKKIRCYRGIRHETGQKVRGQRTRMHGRTGLTVGVIKKGIKKKRG